MAILQATEISGSLTLSQPLRVPSLSNTSIGNLSAQEKAQLVFSSTDSDLYRHDASNIVRGLGYQGLTGVVGAKGTDGSAGLSGYTGLQGLQGSVGTGGGSGDRDGAKGPGGATGYSGLQGATNNQTGTQGPKGPKGGKGPTGYTGYHGAIGGGGPTGDQGPRSGAKGPGGATGYSGLQAATNNQAGTQGPKGPKGPKGPAGYTGFHGADGGTGGGGAYGARDGAKGSAGDTGYSGYHGNANAQTGARGSRSGGKGTAGYTGYMGATNSQGGTYGNTGGGGPPGVSNTGNLYYAYGPGSNWPGPQFQRIFLGGTWNSNHGVDARGGSTAAMYVENYYPASYGWRQFVNSNPYSWTFRGDGNPGNSLHYLKSNGQYYHKGNIQSDQRIKKDITAYTASVLDTKIKDDINASSYIFIGNEISKSEWTASADDEAKIGFVAQHLTASVPELVDMRDLTGLSVDDGGTTALLTKAFQEVSASLTDLGSRIAVLET